MWKVFNYIVKYYYNTIFGKNQSIKKSAVHNRTALLCDYSLIKVILWSDKMLYPISVSITVCYISHTDFGEA